MTANNVFSSPLLIAISTILLLLALYGLVLSIRLMMRGEWQWFCLPFIALPIAITGTILRSFLAHPVSAESLIDIIIWGFSVLVIISLLSAYAVFWLTQKYRSQTGFVNFYGLIYIFNAIVQAGFLIAIVLNNSSGVHFFINSMQVLAFYGIVVTFSGVGIMHFRLKKINQQ